MELFLVILYKLLSDVVREIGFSGLLTLPKLKFAFMIKVLLFAYFLSVSPPPHLIVKWKMDYGRGLG